MKLLVTGFFGVNNLGDDIMLKSFCENLCNIYPKIDITLLFLYGESQNIELPKQVKTIKLNKFKYGKKYIIKYIISKKYDALFWVGGTCFTDKAGDGLYNYMKIFNQQGKLFGYIGVGIGDILDPKRKLQTKFLLENADFITFRDSESYKKSLEINLNNNFYLCEDLVYLMDHNGNKFKKNSSKSIVISWRSFSLYYEELIENNAINILCEFIEKINNDFDEIIIMPIGDKVDTDINNNIYQNLLNRNIIDKIKLYDTNDIDEKVNIIKSSNLFISGRLHGIFISEISNVNTIAIGYDNKIQRFLKSINKEDDLIYPDEFSVDNLMEKYKSRELVNDTVINENYIKSEKNIKYFVEFLKEKEEYYGK